MASTLGKKIKALRGKESQLKFGARLGVDRTTVGSWEIGRHEPCIDILKEIAKIGGVSVDWLCSTVDELTYEEERRLQDHSWHPLIHYANTYEIDPNKILSLLKSARDVCNTQNKNHL